MGLARTVAAEGYTVEVLTTCCSSAFAEWSVNDLPAGTTATPDGITVHRFKCDKRKAEIFAQSSRALDAGLSLSPEEQQAMIDNSINSTDLTDFIAEHKSEYIFVFLPYLYGTTINGMRAAAESKKLLIPCLHDEPIAKFDVFGKMFNTARACLFLSIPEADIAKRLYALPDEKMFLLGGGLADFVTPPTPELFHSHFPAITRPYFLCVGRKVPGKGADIALDYFTRMIDAELLPPSIDFVFIGEGQLEVPTEHKARVHNICCDSNDDILSAMSGAIALIQPSFMESFSIVLMEAWLNKRPVLVNGQCAVTRHHVTTCGGGLWFEDYPTFSEALLTLLDSPSMRATMARNGEKFVRDNWLWPHVGARFKEAIETLF